MNDYELISLLSIIFQNILTIIVIAVSIIAVIVGREK